MFKTLHRQLEHIWDIQFTPCLVAHHPTCCQGSPTPGHLPVPGLTSPAPSSAASGQDPHRLCHLCWYGPRQRKRLCSLHPEGREIARRWAGGAAAGRHNLPLSLFCEQRGKCSPAPVTSSKHCLHFCPPGCLTLAMAVGVWLWQLASCLCNVDGCSVISVILPWSGSAGCSSFSFICKLWKFGSTCS